ncbi:MAG: conjugal transfer protein TraG N-terminal domain-containing protein, partial [Mariprofundales bacterium]
MGTLAVYTFGGGAGLFQTFNAIAAIFGSANYGTMISIIGIIGLIWILVTGAFGKEFNWKWIFVYMFVYNIMFVPTYNVQIIDRLEPAANRVVANVPLGVAQFAHIISTLGDGIT